jgi:hypothetical protein
MKKWNATPTEVMLRLRKLFSSQFYTLFQIFPPFPIFANHWRQPYNTTLFENDGRAIFRWPKHDNCFVEELFSFREPQCPKP